ncbi:glycosyltransferase family 2 protein [Marinibacterium profundimaris]|uniref:glycosyltransferase family 2 protein n=1 Tax=Marinibacterium profundimaris TaxID=1679460 RepID=UPI000B523403|nr:glycosyltransferase family 2 protein [Marinibacterium profundimaris]
MLPRATAIIAAYNAVNELPTSIAAALCQTDVQMEIVVADDASSDETPALMAQYPEVSYFRLEQNGGPSAARNAAIEAATGDWIAVLDADDTMTPGRLASMIAMAEDKNADILLGNFRRVDDKGRPIDDEAYLDPASLDADTPLSIEDYVGHNQLAPGTQNWGYLKPLFRRDFLNRHAIRYDVGLRNSEDYHIILAAIMAGGRVFVSPEPDYLYRVAEGSISHIVAPHLYQALMKAERAFAAALGSDVSPELRRLLANRIHNLAILMHSEEVMFALKSHRPDRAVMALLRYPPAALRVVSQLSEAAGKRMAP